MYNIYIYIHIQYVCIFVSSAMLSTRWPCCLNGELLLEPQVWVNPKLLMAKLHVCLQISYMSIADSWFLFKTTTSVDVGFPWALHGLFQTRSPGRALPGVLHGLPQTWRNRAWIGAGEGPAENMVVSIYLYLYFNLYIYIYVYNWPDFALVQSIPMVMNGTILGRSDIFRGKYLLHGEHGHCFFFQSWQPDSVDDADRTSNGSSVARANSKTL